VWQTGYGTSVPEKGGQMSTLLINYFMLELFSRLGGDLTNLLLLFLCLLLLGLILSLNIARKRQEKQLIHQEENLQWLLEEMKDYAIYLLDINGRVSSWNSGAKQIKGYDSEEIIGQHFSGFYIAADIAQGKPEKLLKAAAKFGRFEEKGWRVRKDGSLFWANVVITALRDQAGNLKGFVQVTQDISVTEITEDELNQTLKELSEIKYALEKAAIVVRTDTQGIIQYANDKFCEISQYSRAELIGQNHRLLFSGYHSPEFFRNLWQTVSRGEIWQGEVKNKAKNGSYYWVDMVIVPLLDKQEKPWQYLAIKTDITQRKNAEEALRESEARFRTLTDVTVEGIVIHQQGKIIDANPTFVRLFGYQLEEIMGMSAEDFLTAESLPVMLANMKSGEEKPYQMTGLRKDGSTFSIEVIGKDYNYKGANMRVASARDITDHQKTEEALKASEQKFRATFNQAAVGMAHVDINGQWLEVNQKLCDIVGYSPEELLSKNFQDITYPDDLDTDLDYARRVLAQEIETYSIEKRYIRKDGSLVWINLTGSLVRNDANEPQYFIAVVEDISVRKQVEAELKSRARQQEAIAYLGQQALSGLELSALMDETVTLIAQTLEVEYCKILELLKEGDSLLLRSGVGWQSGLVGNAILSKGLNSQAGYTLISQEPVVVTDLRQETRFNQPQLLIEHDVISGISVIIPGKNRPWGVLGTYSTKQRRFTQDDIYFFQAAANILAEAIDRSNLYEEQCKALTQAQEANRLKDEFLAVVSHELRTPLNSILGWAQMLRSRKLNEAMVGKALETIERNAKQQVNLIDDILDISRIIRGKIRLEIQPVNLAEVIRETIETVKPAVTAKGIQLKSIIDEQVGQVAGDLSRLHQIVTNLLSNAVKFTADGGQVEIKLGLEERGEGNKQKECVSPNFPYSMSYALITVRDTGKGISAEFLPHVFEGFRQEDGSITRAFGGIGLGLTIVRRLVELHGGSIHAFSEGAGKGATFTVRLPLFKGTEINEIGTRDRRFISPFSASISLVPLSGLRILVVDDDVDSSELVANILLQYGAMVKTAASAAEALEIIERLKPDVLVSDIGMPGEDGYSLIRKVRQRSVERGRDILAIALTAFARDEDRKMAIKAGFQMHVSKPIEPEKLATAIANLMSNY